MVCDSKVWVCFLLLLVCCGWWGACFWFAAFCLNWREVTGAPFLGAARRSGQQGLSLLKRGRWGWVWLELESTGYSALWPVFPPNFSLCFVLFSTVSISRIQGVGNEPSKQLHVQQHPVLQLTFHSLCCHWAVSFFFSLLLPSSPFFSLLLPSL